MSVLVLTEGDSRTAPAWRDHLGIDVSTWEELITNRIFSPVSNRRSSDVQLDFVGVVGLRYIVLACMPRFQIEVSEPISWVRRVLSAYFVRQTRRSYNDTLNDMCFKDEKAFRELDALTFLLSYFAQRGLYRQNISASSVLGSGVIDWARTVDRCQPIVSDGRLLYLEPYRRERRAALDEVSRLQAVATAWLAHRYTSQLPPGLADAVAGINLDAWMSPERAESDLSLLSRRRAVTYLASDLKLIDTLEAVVARKQSTGTETGIHLHGTTAFALVWEDALRDLFGDDSAEVSMGQAIWHDHNQGGSFGRYKARDRRLDVVVRHRGEMLLIDAKYHYPFPISRPGWADIIKQIYYSESAIKEPSESIRNAFFLPRAGDPLTFAGYVRVEHAAREFPPVEAWTLDPGWVFSHYGRGDMTDRERARNTLFAARDEMAKVLRDP